MFLRMYIKYNVEISMVVFRYIFVVIESVEIVVLFWNKNIKVLMIKCKWL